MPPWLLTFSLPPRRSAATFTEATAISENEPGLARPWICHRPGVGGGGAVFLRLGTGPRAVASVAVPSTIPDSMNSVYSSGALHEPPSLVPRHWPSTPDAGAGAGGGVAVWARAGAEVRSSTRGRSLFIVFRTAARCRPA